MMFWAVLVLFILFLVFAVSQGSKELEQKREQKRDLTKEWEREWAEASDEERLQIARNEWADQAELLRQSEEREWIKFQKERQN